MGRRSRWGRRRRLRSISRSFCEGAPLPEHLEVLLIQFYAESNSGFVQDIQKLDACEPKHRRRFPGGDEIVGIKLQDSLLLCGADQFGLRLLVERAVRDVQFK